MPFDAESMQKLVWLVLLLIFAASEAATVGLTSIWCGCRSPCFWR